ncbi:MAG TPA: hypothetical protein VGE83_01100, partial [Terracidiphilus sp.]
SSTTLSLAPGRLQRSIINPTAARNFQLDAGHPRLTCFDAIIWFVLPFVPMEKKIAGKARLAHHAEQLSSWLPWGGRQEAGCANKPGRKKIGCPPF